MIGSGFNAENVLYYAFSLLCSMLGLRGFYRPTWLPVALSKIPDTSVVGKNINVTIINKMDKLIGRGGDLGAEAET